MRQQRFTLFYMTNEATLSSHSQSCQVKVIMTWATKQPFPCHTRAYRGTIGTLGARERTPPKLQYLILNKCKIQWFKISRKCLVGVGHQKLLLFLWWKWKWWNRSQWTVSLCFCFSRKNLTLRRVVFVFLLNGISHRGTFVLVVWEEKFPVVFMCACVCLCG